MSTSTTIGAGTRARFEAQKWGDAGAADRWLARAGVAAMPAIEEEEGDTDREEQIGEALQRERNKNRRNTTRPGSVTVGSGEGEFDPSFDDLRIDDPRAVNKAKREEAAPDLPDLHDIRTHYPEKWARMLQYLKGRPAARRVAWLLSEGIPRDRMPKALGVGMRSVNYAHATLRERMEDMRKKKGVREGQPERRGAEKAAPHGINWKAVRKIKAELPSTQVEAVGAPAAEPALTPEPADDLFEAASIDAPEMPAPMKEKPKRAKAEKPAVQLKLFDCESATTEADDESDDNIQHIEYLFFYRPRRDGSGLHCIPGRVRPRSERCPELEIPRLRRGGAGGIADRPVLFGPWCSKSLHEHRRRAG